MKKAIVTGATSMIGIALTKQLIEKNISVVAVLRKDSIKKGLIPVSPLVEIVECDLHSPAKQVDKRA